MISAEKISWLLEDERLCPTFLVVALLMARDEVVCRGVRSDLRSLGNDVLTQKIRKQFDLLLNEPTGSEAQLVDDVMRLASNYCLNRKKEAKC